MHDATLPSRLNFVVLNSNHPFHSFRQDVVDFIEKRDGFPSKTGNIFLTNGASSGIQAILTGLLANDHDAVMIPIPQYPIYSALITLLCGRQVGYELNEDEGWSVSREQLETQLKISQSEGLTIKAMAMINPGNPTGQVLDEEDVATICQFCADHGIVLLSDEVYQRNVYAKGKKVSSVDLMCLLKFLTLLTRPHHYPFSSIAPKR